MNQSSKKHLRSLNLINLKL